MAAGKPPLVVRLSLIVIGWAADLVRESQRAPAIGAIALLLALTLAIAATSFGPLEAPLAALTFGLLRLADWLPFVRLDPYVDFPPGAPGDVSFSLRGDGTGGAFLTDALLPFVAWLALVLFVIRRLSGRGERRGFRRRYGLVLLICAASGAVYALSAATRGDDVAALWPVYTLLLAAALILGAWAALVSGVLDHLVGGLERLAGARKGGGG